jgi:hypothetical protein
MESFPINIWINEERLEKLRLAGLDDMAEDVFAGLKKLSIPANVQQRDEILRIFPSAKYDSATTNSIELLPRDAKESLFSLILEMKTLKVLDRFISSIQRT